MHGGNKIDFKTLQCIALIYYLVYSANRQCAMGKEHGEIPNQYPNWENARLPKSIYNDSTNYLISLTLTDDSAKKIYAIMSTPDPTNQYDSFSVDIPVEDYTSKPDLVNDAYLHATVWGERDEVSYLHFATEYGKLRPLLALLNRETAGTRPRDAAEWFYDSFGVKHAETYTSVHISSFGSDRTFDVTLRPVYRRQQMVHHESPVHQAVQFAETIQRSLPNVIVEPVAMDTYLDTLYNSLQFLPRDWEN